MSGGTLIALVGLGVVVIVAAWQTVVHVKESRAARRRGKLLNALAPYGTNAQPTSANVAPTPVDRAAGINGSTSPRPIERAERMSPTPPPVSARVEADVAVAEIAATPPKRTSKPRATTQTVLEVVKGLDSPTSAKAIARELRGTTPAKVSAILVGLRRSKKVKSQLGTGAQRNLQLWSAT